MRFAELIKVSRADSTLVSRTAENVARSVNRKSFLKKALVAGVTVTYLDKLASPARASDAPVYIDYGPSPLTESLDVMAMGCCTGSPACFTFGNPACGCENGCCYEPAHSGNKCVRRFCNGNAYCWLCQQDSYVCCDYKCYGNWCHCGSQCTFNECGTGFC
jgi:hypothetical protein